MEAKELRIGNFIKDIKNPERHANVFRLSCGNEHQITYSYSKAFEHTPKDKNDLQGIPLTEDWLLKLGFEKKEDCEGYFKDGILFLNGLITVVQKVKCEYVHRLQNLYFALTGQELTIK